MLVDGRRLIAAQLKVDAPTPIMFKDKSRTTLQPARLVPVPEGQERRVTLDGAWRVARWPFDLPERQLLRGNAPPAAWSSVEQPGKVFYDDPETDPTTIPDWDRVTLAHIDAKDGAVLLREVSVPEGWQGKRVFLRFEGIYPGGKVYVDGKRVGEHLSGLTPVVWDVTDRVRPGRTHHVAVRLFRKHPFVQLDMPRHAAGFAGLNRSAYLYAVEPVHVADHHLVSELAADCKTGRVSGSVTVANAATASHKGHVTVRVLDAAARFVAEQRMAFAARFGKQATVDIGLDVGRVKPWNDERPNLYRIELSVHVPGQPECVVAWRTGFRRFELTDQRAYLNGRPVKFRGINHLTYHPEHGMYTPVAWLRECLALMKRANVNAIRTHFCGPPELTELCDEMGIYLLQELPIDWGHTYVHDPRWLGPILYRLEGAVRRDRPHPSVMVWSVGNENLPRNDAEHDDFWNHLRIFDRFVKTLDPTRPTMFPPPGPANRIKGIFETRVGDVGDTHYSFTIAEDLQRTGKMTNPATWERRMETTTREQAVRHGWSGVWFSSEYGITNLQADLLNAPYLAIISDVAEDALSGKNSQQATMDRLAREWGLMRDDPTCLGGAYFCWVAAGAGDPWGWTRWAEDNDWGVVTADLVPKPAFWAVRTAFSPVQFPQRVAWKAGAKHIRFKVANGFNAIDLSECTLRTQMGGGPPRLGGMRGWKDITVRGRPGDTATVTIPIWNPQSLTVLQNGAPIACRCILLDPGGRRVIMADVIVEPPEQRDYADTVLTIGPDAE